MLVLYALSPSMNRITTRELRPPRRYSKKKKIVFDDVICRQKQIVSAKNTSFNLRFFEGSLNSQQRCFCFHFSVNQFLNFLFKMVLRFCVFVIVSGHKCYVEYRWNFGRLKIIFSQCLTGVKTVIFWGLSDSVLKCSTNFSFMDLLKCEFTMLIMKYFLND